MSAARSHSDFCGSAPAGWSGTDRNGCLQASHCTVSAVRRLSVAGVCMCWQCGQVHVGVGGSCLLRVRGITLTPSCFRLCTTGKLRPWKAGADGVGASGLVIAGRVALGPDPRLSISRQWVNAAPVAKLASRGFTKFYFFYAEFVVSCLGHTSQSNDHVPRHEAH